MKKKTRFLFISILFLTNSILLAQDSKSNRTEIWKGFNISSKIKKFEFKIAGQIRLKDFGELYNQSLIDFKLNYKLLSFMNIGYEKRLINAYDDFGKEIGFDNFHRDKTFISFQYKFDRSKIKLTIKNQKKYSYNELKSHKNNEFWRIEFENDYNIKNFKYDPIIGFEIFYKNEIDFSSSYDKYRIQLGSSLGKKKNFSLKYMFENTTGNNIRNPTHILKSIYKFDVFKFKKTKKVFKSFW